MVLPQQLNLDNAAANAVSLDSNPKGGDNGGEDDDEAFVDARSGASDEDDSDYVACAESALDEDEEGGDHDVAAMKYDAGKSADKDLQVNGGGTSRSKRNQPESVRTPDKQPNQQQQLRQSQRRRKKRRRYAEEDSDDDDQEDEETPQAPRSRQHKKKERSSAASSSAARPANRGAKACNFEEEDNEDDTTPELRAKSVARKLERFDVSSLLPLTRAENNRNDDRRKTRIELLCKLTGSIHVCFPSIDYAAQALGTTRKAVRRACRRFATSLAVAPMDEEEEAESAFATCHLRHVAESSAYVYGEHARDFLFCEETHQERLEHWAELQEATKDPRVTSLIDDDEEEQEAEDRDISTATARRTDSKRSLHASSTFEDANKHQNQGRQAAHKAHVLGILEGAALWEQPPKREDVTTPEINKIDDRPFLSYCVACQVKHAVVVLEPCHHCILCRDCASQWCPIFCPKCRTKILGRLHPQSGTCLIQPALYSGYSFL
jgi:hypothetical protein